jgi:hypothetical protein
MQARLVNTAPEKVEADALILPVFEGEKTVPAEAAGLDKKLKGTIADLLKGDGFNGKFMELVPVHNLSSLPSRWTVLAGVGKREHLDMVRLRNVLQAASRTLRRRGNRTVAVIVPMDVARRASGADVAELKADLVALGYATSAQLGPTSASFWSATTTAVKKLQAALGMTQTGTLTLGQAVFEPTAVRVTTMSAQLGGNTQTGETVMQATSTTRIVQVALVASQQTEVAVGDTVTITLPNNKTTPGVVSSIGAVATCPSSSGSGRSSSSSAAPGTDTCSSGNSGSTTPTISVDVTPSDPAATGTWDQAPVRVGITTATVPSALAVPVTALLAQSGGGYAVEVVNAGGINHLVPVSLGLFDDADGLVQISGSGLAAGQQVVVPTT